LDSRAVAKQKSLVGSPAVAVMQDAMIVKGQTLARPQK
jgi:hypothetical protein